jgi:hypothetical protein
MKLAGSKKQKNKIMKIKCLQICVLSVAAGAFVSGCVVEPNGRVAFEPIVVAAPRPVYVEPQPVYVQPAPVVEEQVMVPDSYVWDGYENVGIIGGQYYYLGAGNVWVVAEPFRLERFHGWEGGHPDWREHVTVNVNFRTDAHGHYQPRHDDQQRHDDRKVAPASGTKRKTSIDWHC